MSKPWTVRDIRTGRALAQTRNMTEVFTSYVKDLLESDKEFYLVFGRCQHLDVRSTVSFLQELDAIEAIHDPKMPPDTIWIFEGHPAELGFAS